MVFSLPLKKKKKQKNFCTIDMKVYNIFGIQLDIVISGMRTLFTSIRIFNYTAIVSSFIVAYKLNFVAIRAKEIHYIKPSFIIPHMVGFLFL